MSLLHNKMDKKSDSKFSIRQYSDVTNKIYFLFTQLTVRLKRNNVPGFIVFVFFFLFMYLHLTARLILNHNPVASKKFEFTDFITLLISGTFESTSQYTLLLPIYISIVCTICYIILILFSFLLNLRYIRYITTIFLNTAFIALPLSIFFIINSFVKGYTEIETNGIVQEIFFRADNSPFSDSCGLGDMHNLVF